MSTAVGRDEKSKKGVDPTSLPMTYFAPVSVFNLCFVCSCLSFVELSVSCLWVSCTAVGTQKQDQSRMGAPVSCKKDGLLQMSNESLVFFFDKIG